MLEIYIYIIIFIVVFLLRYILFILGKKKRKLNLSFEKRYLEYKFNISKNKLSNNYINFVLSLNDAFIITSTLALTFMITKNMILQILIGVVSMVLLIFITNEIIGNILKGKDR